MATTYDYTLVLSDGVAYKNSAAAGNEVTLAGLSYDDGIWTMDNFSFTTTADTALKIDGDAETTITVTGENSITGGDSSSVFGGAHGAYVYVETNLQGTGSLTIESGEPGMSGSDIEIEKDLSIQGITLTLKSRSDNYSILYGTCVMGSATLTVEDATVNVGLHLSFYQNANTTVNGTGKITVDGSVRGQNEPQAAAHDSDGNELTWNGSTYQNAEGKEAQKVVLTAAGPTIADATVTLGETEYTYAGTAFAPTVTVTMPEGTVLAQDTDYTLTYSDNVDAGTATVTVKGIGDYSGTNGATFTIAKREVTLTSASDTKIYDETPLTNDTVTVGGDGWVEGQGATYTVTGSQTEVGSSANTFTYTLNEGTKAGNYAITQEYGTLSVIRLDKDTYDAMIADPEFVYPEEKGALKVEYATGNALRTEDIDILMAKEGVNNVAFQQDLISVRKLTLNAAGVTKTISFYDGYGTVKSDTIRFAKDVDVIFGQAGYELNLEEGSNKIQVDKRANAVIKSNLTNVSKITTSSDSVVILADVDFQLGRNASVSAQGKCFHTGSINGTDKKTTITIGKGTDFNSGNIALADKGDKISAGKNSNAGIGTISTTETGLVQFLGSEVDFNGGNDTLEAKGAVFATGAVDFGAGNDKLTVGENSKFFAAQEWIGDWEKPAEAKYVTADLAFGDGNDKLSTGRNAIFAAGVVSGIETISLGRNSTTQLDRVSGVKKLSVADGSQTAYTKFAVQEITGSDYADRLSTGRYVDFTAGTGSIALGDGDDQIAIGCDSSFTAGDVALGAGKNKISVSNRSEVTLDNVTGVYRLSVSNGSQSDHTTFTAARIEGTKDYGDKISTGCYVDFTAESISLKGGANQIAIGRDGKFTVTGGEYDRGIDFGSDGKDQMSVGSRSDVSVNGNILALNKLTVSDGSKSDLTTFGAMELRGTENNDNFSFGSYVELTAGTVSLGDGNDTLSFGNCSSGTITGNLIFGEGNDALTIGKNSMVDIASLDFGEGTKDKLTISKDAKLTVVDLDVASLDKVSMSSGAELWLGAASYNAAMETEWGKKYSGQISELA